MSHLAAGAAVSTAPSGWTRTRLKAVCERREERRGTRSIALLSLASAGYLIPRSTSGDRQAPSEDSLPRYLVVNPGDLVVNPMWLTGGSIAVSDLSGAVSPDYRVFRPSRDVHPRFLHHVLRCEPYFDQYRLYARADTTFDRRVQQEDLDQLPLALPPLDVQRRIADFLDDQVARIDAAMELRRQQSEQCRESMASWLEEEFESGSPTVPVKAVATLITSGPRGWGDYVGDKGWPFLRITNIRKQGIDVDRSDIALVQAPPGPDRQRTRTQAEDVLVSITAELGSVAVVPSDLADANVSQHVALVRPDRRRCHPAWLAWILQVPARRAALTTSGYGGTKVGLGLAEVANIRIPDLALEDQVASARRAEQEWKAREDLRTAINAQAQFLTERKRALITAAVTGEFDVSTAGPRAAAAVMA